MAANPAFTATARVGVGSVSTANTNRDGTGTIVTILSAGASGTKISQVAAVATADPADSTVTIFLHDGTNFWYFDEFDIGNPAAASSVQAAYRTFKSYSDLVLPNGWSLRAAITATLTSGVVNVFALGGDL